MTEQGDDRLIEVAIGGVSSQHIDFSVHLKPETIVPQNDDGSEGAGKTVEITAENCLANRSALADRADEKWDCDAPYHPVSPVEDRPGLWERGGSHRIRPRRKSDEILRKISERSDACFHDEAGLTAEKEDVGEKSEKQVGTAGSGELYALHAEEDCKCVDCADNNQNQNRQTCGLGNSGHTADCKRKQRSREGECRCGSGEKREDSDEVDDSSSPAIHTVAEERSTGLRIFLFFPVADMEHESESDRENHIESPRDRTPVKQRIGGSPVLNRAHLCDMWVGGIEHPFTAGVKQDVGCESGREHHRAPLKA